MWSDDAFVGAGNWMKGLS